MVIDDIFLSQVIGMLAVSLPKRTLRFCWRKIYLGLLVTMLKITYKPTLTRLRNSFMKINIANDNKNCFYVNDKYDQKLLLHH